MNPECVYPEQRTSAGRSSCQKRSKSGVSKVSSPCILLFGACPRHVYG